jgi:death-on-curing protein
VKEPRWLSVNVVLAIRTDQVREHGGSSGTANTALLESALDRARNKFLYEPDADIASLAAAYGFGITKNHPFVDGNKRVAFQAMYVFLGINKRRISAPEIEVVRLMLGLAAGEVTEPELADWLRANSRTRR